MNDELNRGLLNKKVGFDRTYEDALIRVAKIRQKNDAFQKHIGPEIEDELKSQIQAQNQYLEKEIRQLKELLNQLESKYRDPESKNKIKTLKADAQKQIERNKIILKDIIRSSFHHDEDHPAPHLVDEPLAAKRRNQPGSDDLGRGDLKGDSLLTDPQQAEIEIDYELERKIMQEKNVLFNEVEQSTARIHEIMNDVAVMVDEQGQNLDVISEELMTANRNLQDTNTQMDEAVILQKKSRKKYIILIAIIIILVLGGVGVIVILTT